MPSKNSKSVEESLQTSKLKENDFNHPAKCGSFSEKLGIIFRNITVEPIIVLYAVSNSMCMIALQNLSLEKACRVNLAMDEKICDAMSSRNTSGYDESDEVLVQKLVTSMYAWKNVVECSVPSLLLLFLGSWSGRHRMRKPCILIPILGELFAIAGATLCTFFYHQLSIEYNIFFEASSNLVGGPFLVFMGILVYVGEITSVEERTLRIGAASICQSASFTIGLALSGVLYTLLGFYGVFFLSFLLYTTCLLYGVYCVAEVPNDLDSRVCREEGLGSIIKDVFNIEHVRNTFEAALESGTRRRRLVVCLLIVLMMVLIGPIIGEEGVMYLFVRYKFGWDGLDYSFYRTFNTLIHMAAAVVEMFNGTSFVMMRSIISKLVEADDLGKVHSLLSVADCFIPLLYGPAYNLFYKVTIETMPAAFFFLGAVLTLPALLNYLFLYFESRRVLEKRANSEDFARKSDGMRINETNQEYDVT